MASIHVWSTAALLGLGAVAYAQDSASNQQLLQELRQLKAEVAQLKATTQPAANSRDTDVVVGNLVREARQEVLRDAQSRTLSLDEARPFSGGWKGGKFIIQSEDGNYSLSPGLQFQARYAGNWRDGGGVHGGDDMTSGFEIRRMKLNFSGNVISPDLLYEVQWATSRSNGSLSLEDAYGKYRFHDEFYVKAGQFKDPLAHEQIVSSKRSMAADRSYLNDVLIVGDNYVQGASLGWGYKSPLQAEVAFTDGSGSQNTDWRNAFPGTNRPDFGVAGRAQYKLLGDWKQYDDFSALGNEKDLLVAGIGGDWTENGGTDQYLHTADLQYENAGGLGLYAAYVARYTTVGGPAAGAQGELYDWGFVGQAGYMLDKRHWEIFGRYGMLNLDQTGDQVNEIAAGLNYFFSGHAAKVTLDVTYLPDGAPVADEGGAILASPDPEVVVRIQFQLLI